MAEIDYTPLYFEILNTFPENKTYSLIVSKSKRTQRDKYRILKKLKFSLKNEKAYDSMNLFSPPSSLPLTDNFPSSTNIDTTPKRIIHNDFADISRFKSNVQNQKTIRIEDHVIMIDKTSKKNISNDSDSFLSSKNPLLNSNVKATEKRSVGESSRDDVGINENDDKAQKALIECNESRNKIKSANSLSHFPPLMDKMFRDTQTIPHLLTEFNTEEDYSKQKTGIHSFKSYEFIEDIRKNISDKNKIINLSKLIHLNNNALFHLCLMCGDSLSKLLIINEIMHKRINYAFCMTYNKVINDFKHNYSTYITLDKVFFEYKKNTSSINNSYCMNIQFKITSHDILKRIYFTYDYKWFKHKLNLQTLKIKRKSSKQCDTTTNTEDDNLFESFVVDIVPKSYNYAFYLISEISRYKTFSFRYSYTAPSIVCAVGDTVLISLDIISKFGYKMPSAIQWRAPNVLKKTIQSLECFEKSLHHISDKHFDPLRSSNFEMLVHLWHNVNYKEIKKHKCVNDFLYLYKEHFSIEHVMYDNENLKVYKIRMKARKIGIVNRNKYINFCIRIKSKNSQLTNECSSTGLLNLKLITESFDIVIGTRILAYLTDE